MPTETVNIIVNEQGSRTVRRNLDDLANTSRRVGGAIDFVRNSLHLLGGALATRQIINYANTYVNLQNRIRATGAETKQLTGIYSELLSVANATRSDLEGTVETYSRLAISSKELGVSQRELIDFTKSLNQAIILSGASAQEAQAGMIQLSQGLASGALRGDELRSVLEQLPTVADVIAKNLKVTRGELRTLGTEGKITANVVLDAFKNARVELDEKFGKSVPTIGQSFTVLKNNFVDFVGRLDESVGLTTKLSKLIFTLANNLDLAAKSALALSSGLIIVGGTRRSIDLLVGSVRALTLAIAANPLGALAIVLTTVITSITLFRDEIKLGIDDVTTLGDLMRAVGEVFYSVFRNVLALAKSTFGPLYDLISGFVKEIDFSVIGVIRFTAKGLDTYVGLWKGAVFAIIELFKGLLPALGDLFSRALNFLLKKISDFVNEAIGILNPVLQFLKQEQIAKVTFEFDNEFEGRAKNLGENINRAMSDGLQNSTFFQDGLDKIVSRAKEISANRLAQPGQSVVPVSDESGEGVRVLTEQEKKLQKILNDLRARNELLKLGYEERKAGLEILEIERKLEIQLTNEQRSSLIGLQKENELLQLRANILDSIIEPQNQFKDSLRSINELLTSGQISLSENNKLIIDQIGSIYQAGIDSTNNFVESYRNALGMIDDLRNQDLISEDTYQKSKAELTRKYNETRLGHAQTFFGKIASLSQTGNSKLIAVGRAAAITEATIQGILAVQRARAAAPPPYNYFLAAAEAVAAGINVAKIASTRALGGSVNAGDFVNVGESSFNRPELFQGQSGKQFLIPPERGNIMPIRETPRQNTSQNSNQPIEVKVEPKLNIANVVGDDMFESWANSPAGESVIMNVVRRNQE